MPVFLAARFFADSCCSPRFVSTKIQHILTPPPPPPPLNTPSPCGCQNGCLLQMGEGSGKRLSVALDGMEYAVRQPTLGELRRVAFISAVPFVGFGIMDNAIMIIVSIVCKRSKGCCYYSKVYVVSLWMLSRRGGYRGGYRGYVVSIVVSICRYCSS